MKKELKTLIKLSSQVAIYVPSTINVNEKADTAQYVDNTLGFLSDLFGGATATAAYGAWRCTDGSIVKENVMMCFAYTNSETLERSIDKIVAYCEVMCKDLQQEAISLEINRELYFISE